MANIRTLLIMPHFWDPICVPLGISALKAYGDRAGHAVHLFDFNTVRDVFAAQRAYFEEGKRQFPYWKKWGIERNGTQTFAYHQMVYLHARTRPNYRELVAEVLNVNQRPLGEFLDDLDASRFDAIFSRLYTRVGAIFEKVLAETKPEVVGCTLLNSTVPGTLFLLKRVKELLPGARTVVGGPGPMMGLSSNENEVRAFFDRHDFLDYYVVGEGEKSFVQILDNPDLPRGVINPDKGLAIVEIKRNAQKIDDLPLPDYGTLNVAKYLQLSIASSRGCPFECSFCSETVYWKGFRAIDRSLIFGQLDALGTRYNRTSFFLCDSLANQVIGSLTAEIAASGKPYKIDCYLRADRICTDESRTKEWRAGGLFRARLGMESASQRILDAMVKKTNPENMAKSLHALASQGIMTTTLWIAGYPGETEQEFDSTLAFIRENRRNIFQADIQIFQYHPEGLAHSDTIAAQNDWGYRYSTDLNEVFALKPSQVGSNITEAERYHRLERFVDEMSRLQIPNPYGVFEWVAAENRWKALAHESGWDPRRSMMSLNA